MPAMTIAARHPKISFFIILSSMLEVANDTNQAIYDATVQEIFFAVIILGMIFKKNRQSAGGDIGEIFGYVRRKAKRMFNTASQGA